MVRLFVAGPAARDVNNMATDLCSRLATPTSVAATAAVTVVVNAE
jgi:hypothetical protein